MAWLGPGSLRDVSEILPLKQGLKHPFVPFTAAFAIGVSEILPLKQGLKHGNEVPPAATVWLVSEILPLKQGLKLLIGGINCN